MLPNHLSLSQSIYLSIYLSIAMIVNGLQYPEATRRHKQISQYRYFACQISAQIYLPTIR